MRIDYEQSLLKKVIVSEDFSFKEELFSGQCKLIYGVLKDYYQDYGKIPDDNTLEDVLSSYSNGDKLFAIYKECLYAEDLEIEYLVDKLEEEFYLKQAKEHVDKFNEDVENVGIKKAYSNLTDALLSAQNEELNIERGFVWESIKDRWNDFKDRAENPNKLSGTSFHIKCLDENLGGRNDNTLMMFVGLPGTGKTTIKLNLAYNLSRFENQDVMFISGELKKKEIEILVDARDSMIDGMLIRTGNLSQRFKEAYHQALLRQLKRKDNLYVVEMEPGFTVRDVNSEILRYRKEFGKLPQTLVVDYLWIMDAINKYGSFAERLGNCAFELRHLIAKKYGMCVISSTQESRTGAILKRQNKERDMESIGESHKIAPNCHTIIMLDVNNNSVELELFNKVRLSCVKNTLGKSSWREDLVYLREFSYVGDDTINLDNTEVDNI